MNEQNKDKLKIRIFAGVMMAGAVLGLLLFLRPTVSAREKRVLTKFPTSSETDVLDGSFFAAVEKWYADTYPGRDFFTGFYHTLQGLWGTSRVQSTDSGKSDDIPTDIPDVPDTPDTPDTPDDPAEQEGETVGGFLLIGDTAYEKYYFSQDNSLRYAALIAKAQTLLGDDATVYDLVVPLSYAVNLNEKTRAKYNLTDIGAATDFIYAAIAKKNAGVVTVPVLAALQAHNDEYVYFRTDHHWTQRGAYYAYAAFCEAAGITASKLTDYTDVRAFEGFLGTLYADTGEPAAMKKNPDVVEAYVPRGTNRIELYDADGNKTIYSTGVVQIKTDTIFQAAGSKYNCFIMGDNALSVIHNDNIAADRAGTSIVLVKESFGNAFAPFLVDSYEYVYVIDYRYYKGTLTDFVSTHNVDTVLFVNNAVATSASARLNEMDKFIQ